MAWKVKSSTEKYRNRFMTVTEDKVLNNSGDLLTFGIVHKKPGVSIVPWDGTHFYIIGQFRYAVDSFSWEFPAGHTEQKGDTVEIAANRELQEEAGLQAEHITKIGEFFIAPGHNSQIIEFYLATKLSPAQRDLEPSEEGMQVKKVTHTELNQMIKEGTVKDSLTIAALKFFELHHNEKA